MAVKLTSDEIKKAAQTLGHAWQITDNKKLIYKQKLNGFNAACHHANLAAFVRGQLNQHADISFGWGYCDFAISSLDVGGLSPLDFDFAAQFDRACTSKPTP